MLKLREIEKSDLTVINQWRNDTDLISYLGAPFRYINFDTDVNWYNEYLQKRSSSIRCAIVNENNDILGLVSLLNIDYINRSAVLHIMIGDKNSRGKGIGSFAVNSIVDHAFDNLNLRRIELEVLESNSIARHLYRKCGFLEEGVKKEAVFKNGTYVSLIMMAKMKN